MANLSHELREESRNVVTKMIDVLRGQELQLPKISSMDVHYFPVGVLAYQLYGGKDRIERTSTLINLNGGQVAMLFDEEVDVLAGL